jgi:hypothetical protein
MAQRIDNGIQPTAHTAVQAMIVRAQQAADHTGKAVGVHYDLEADQVSLVEIGPDLPSNVTFVRVASPEGGVRVDAPGAAVAGTESPKPEVKAATA